MLSLNNSIGWNFNNTYIELPNILMTKVEPAKAPSPNLVILNKELSKDLNLNFENNENKDLASIFSGNILPLGSETIAQAYAGHQFGYFSILGDGRALLLGEHINNKNKRFDIQFKGSGKTPYSRNGDGKATLESMLREYLISEAMFGLKIPTTRSLAVVTTGENVLRERKFQGAILTRVASSHIRVGTFQFASIQKDSNILNQLFEYTVKRHYPEFNNIKNKAENLLKALIEKQIDLVINWMRVGFVHGVLNSDNVTLSGETIDYGPCSFMDYYNPNTVFSSIDMKGRYSFINQEIISHWNVSRFAETLIPLLSDNREKAIQIGSEIINEFSKIFKTKWLNMMRKKFGFIGECDEDENFFKRFLSWMEKNTVDYTNTFLYLMNCDIIHNPNYQKPSFQNLYKEWEIRKNKNNNTKESSIKLMKINNPVIIPRNHIVEKALEEVGQNNNYTYFNNLLELIKTPYENKKNISEFMNPPSLEFVKNYQTFCGT